MFQHYYCMGIAKMGNRLGFLFREKLVDIDKFIDDSLESV